MRPPPFPFDVPRAADAPVGFAFRLAAARATVRTHNARFRERFLELFRDCLEGVDGQSHALTADLEVVASSHDDAVFARISAHDGANARARLTTIFPELDLVDALCEPCRGWSLLARRSAPAVPVVAICRDGLLLDASTPWQILVTHYFIDHLMRLQPDWGFFHAATMTMGSSGVFLAGAKGAGKSSLSLALAARGHAFLGDEIAAIHADTGEIAAFPRAVSIRPGPQAHAVERYFERQGPEARTRADGTDRIRLAVSRIFPDAAPRPARLTHAFFLEEHAPAPHAERLQFAARDLSRLGPLHGTLDAQAAAKKVIRFLNLFSGIECYRLSPGGGPDRTSELIESIVEGEWDTPCRNGPNGSARSAGSRFN
jgi:hypothetical protein